MLKEDYKQTFVLIVFSFLLMEVLTGATLLFVLVGALIVFFQIRTSKIIRNALAMGVFASYWLKYGKVIDPEIGLNFLTSIIVLKILERETIRDRYMIFFGLLLLISSGSPTITGIAPEIIASYILKHSRTLLPLPIGTKIVFL